MAARGSRKARYRRAVLASAAALVLGFVAMCVPVYGAHDDVFDVHKIDAVFILGPPTTDRIELGERIAREAGGIPVYLSVWAGVGCEPQFECVHADPWTTVGEARALADAVRLDGVRRPLVVTRDVHVMRARFILARCVPLRTAVIGVHSDLTIGDAVWQPIYQWGAMVKFLLGGCADGSP